MSFNIIVPLDFKDFTPEIARRRHIEIAREGLKDYLRRSRDKPNYQIIVDNVLASSEEQLKPFGKITYVFLRMSQIGKLAIQTARDLSPVESGRYKRSWILIADKQLVNENSIPENIDELILVNFQPYARKIHVRGARLRGVPPGIVEKVRQIVLKRFRNNFVVNLEFMNLPNAYILRKDYIQKRRSGKTRLHTARGNELTYPALVIHQKY